MEGVGTLHAADLAGGGGGCGGRVGEHQLMKPIIHGCIFSRAGFGFNRTEVSGLRGQKFYIL